MREENINTFRWQKLGRIFDPSHYNYDIPWMREFAQAPSTLVFNDYVRVYFSCRPGADENGQYVSYTGFVDLDRWDLRNVLRVSKQPILPLGNTGTFDEFGVYPATVIPNGSTLRAYYGGWTRCESTPFNVSIGMAESSDGGETFQRLGDGPVLAASLYEPFVISGPKIRKFDSLWHLFYIAGRKWIIDNGRAEPVYKIRKAYSQDGIEWVCQNKDLIPDVLGSNEAQASPDVIYQNGRYHMFFCFRHGTNYRGPRGYRIGYATSDDLINWERDDAQAGISISDSGWDDETISYPHVFELDGNVYLMYLGNEVGRHGFGLAVLDGNL